MVYQRLLLVLFVLQSCTGVIRQETNGQWVEWASQVSITRDQWGIPHIYGKTDAATVFGLLYAQCEDNFPAVENSYLEKMGRLSELGGKDFLYADLLARLQQDSSQAISDYKKCSPEMKSLLDAFAGGVNYFLQTHPTVKPQVLQHFEPWYALLFTDGSYTGPPTGGITVSDMRSLYLLPISDSEKTAAALMPRLQESGGSNAFAIGPSKSADSGTMLYINPHTSFYYRTEAHLISEEGLNAYGAITWGQFFVFQGFNEHCGWMHTSSVADAADLYAETVEEKNGAFHFIYENEWKPFIRKNIVLRYREEASMKEKQLDIFSNPHGSATGIRDGKWLTMKTSGFGLKSLQQSWDRMKTNDFDQFQEVLNKRANSSTNTMYADDKGNIAYWHGNFVPKRDTAFNWSTPVDGSIRASEWQGMHPLDELVHFRNPASGYLQNCNSSPFTAAGDQLARPAAMPSYLAPESENFRSIHARRLLAANEKISPDQLMQIGFSPYLTAFEFLLPPLLQAYDSLPANHELSEKLRAPMDSLRAWDGNTSINAIAPTLAILWAEQVVSVVDVAPGSFYDQLQLFRDLKKQITAEQQLEIFSEVINWLEKNFGRWQLPWGEINRFQRPAPDGSFSDDSTSYPVALGPSLFGSLPSFETTWPKTKTGYGYSGNSFVALVSFGKKLHAWSALPGGHAFDKQSVHYLDQVKAFTEGQLKPVYFYKEDVLANAEKTYQPGKAE